MYVYWFIVGACIGSFLGVFIDRIPQGASIIHRRSHCDHCKKTLRWFELIPLLSFFLQKGKCRRCHRSLSLRYPLIEIVTAVTCALLWIVYAPAILPFILSFIVACTLIVIMVIDYNHMIIPDSMLIIGSVATLVYHAVRLGSEAFVTLFQNYMITGVLSTVVFYLLWLGTKKKGIGFGDVKLVFLLGFLAGFPRVFLSFYLAFLTGAMIAIILVLQGQKTMKSAVPFGPFLILGTVLSLFIDVQKVLSFVL